MSQPLPPKLSVVKRLFARSKNQCAFPECLTPNAPGERDDGILADICHICGEKPGSARYDSTQTNEERRSYGNLMLMCPTHHRVVDNNPSKYDVEFLMGLKQAHESDAEDPSIIPEYASLHALCEATLNVQGGSVIHNVNQSGGQVAHQITNIGRPTRHLSASAASALTCCAAACGSTSFVAASVSDDEAKAFSKQIEAALLAAGWTTPGSRTYPALQEAKAGIEVVAKYPCPPALAVGQQLLDLGYDVIGVPWSADVADDVLMVLVRGSR